MFIKYGYKLGIHGMVMSYVYMCLALLFGYERDELYVRKVRGNPLSRVLLISYEYINLSD